MDIKEKNILVFGLGISGVSTIKTLSKLGANITVLDSKEKDELGNFLKEVDSIKFKSIFGSLDIDLTNIDLIIKSPGIPPSNKVIIEAKKREIEVITDLELGFLLSETENIIAITGTNGKTSTTTLVGQLFKKANYNTFVCGNIGIGILETVSKANKNDVIVIECSSFQLEDTIKFNPKVSALINIKPDHLNWHETFENYKDAKLKVYKNQTRKDFAVINYDDEYIRNYSKRLESKKIYFSIKEELEEGVFLKDGYIVSKFNGILNRIIDKSYLDIFLENALSAVAIGISMDISIDIIKKSLSEFVALPHRMEFVDTINGVKYYNDSKGTNPDSTIKAIENTDEGIILIAGGYDKGSDFSELLQIGREKIKALILLGQTKEKIEKTAIQMGYKNIYLVIDLEEAVQKAVKISVQKDKVLLSPACASWGMYQNFEERGNHFKELVEKIKVAEYEKK